MTHNVQQTRRRKPAARRARRQLLRRIHGGKILPGPVVPTGSRQARIGETGVIAKNDRQRQGQLIDWARLAPCFPRGADREATRPRGATHRFGIHTPRAARLRTEREGGERDLRHGGPYVKIGYRFRDITEIGKQNVSKEVTMSHLEFLIEKGKSIYGSQKALAAALGKPHTHISMWKSGERPCTAPDRAELAAAVGEDPTRAAIEAVMESVNPDTEPGREAIAGLRAMLAAFPAEQPTIAAAPQSGGATARGVVANKPRLRKSLRT